jgi:hypothetical protein
LIYRHYATLYFIFAVDASESELGILDLIQVFVEALDKCFENVCELDLIFHVDKIHHILDEIVVAGMVSDEQQQADSAAVPCPLSSFFVAESRELCVGLCAFLWQVLETSLKEILKAVNGTLKHARDTQAQAEQNTKIGENRQRK